MLDLGKLNPCLSQRFPTLITNSNIGLITNVNLELDRLFREEKQGVGNPRFANDFGCIFPEMTSSADCHVALQ